MARRNGLYPSDYRLQPCKVETAIADAGRVRFAGDTVFAGGKMTLIVIPGANLLTLAASVARRAHDHVERAHRAFVSMLPPPQILQ